MGGINEGVFPWFCGLVLTSKKKKKKREEKREERNKLSPRQFSTNFCETQWYIVETFATIERYFFITFGEEGGEKKKCQRIAMIFAARMFREIESILNYPLVETFRQFICWTILVKSGGSVPNFKNFRKFFEASPKWGKERKLFQKWGGGWKKEISNFENF